MRQFLGNRHLQSRDFRRALLATSATGTVASASAVDFGQTWSITAFANFATFSATQSIITCSGVGGVRFRVNTSGGLLVDNADTGGQSTSPNNVVPRNTWVGLAATVDSGRVVRLYVDGELVHSSTLTSVAPWLAAIASVSVAQGTRIERVRVHRGVVLNQAQIRGEFYSWSAPTPTFTMPCNEGFGTNTVDEIGGVVCSITGMVWSRDVPQAPYRVPMPIGYSVAANFNGTDAYYGQRLIGSSMMTAIRGQAGLSIGARVKLLNVPDAAFTGARVITLTQAGGANAGPSIRLKWTNATRLLELTHNGRPGAGTGSITETLPNPAINLLPLLLNRWGSLVINYDYVAGQIRFFINGIRVDTEADTQVALGGGYHSDAVVGDEQVWTGAINAGARFSTNQTDHFVCGRALTDAEVRAWHLTGALANPAYRLLYLEGSNNVTADAAGGGTTSLTRGGTPTTTAWRSDVP